MRKHLHTLVREEREKNKERKKFYCSQTVSSPHTCCTTRKRTSVCFQCLHVRQGFIVVYAVRRETSDVHLLARARHAQPPFLFINILYL